MHAPDSGDSGAGDDVGRVDVDLRVEGDPARLGRLLAVVEPLRDDTSARIVTDADAEVVRFLAVLAVLEGRAPMPDHDLEDASMKWHAPAGVEAVPNPPSGTSRPSAPGAPGAPGAPSAPSAEAAS